MEENVFMTGGKTLTLEDYLQYDAGSRDNLGEELPVMVYRLLEYSLKEELIGHSFTCLLRSWSTRSTNN